MRSSIAYALSNTCRSTNQGSPPRSRGWWLDEAATREWRSGWSSGQIGIRSSSRISSAKPSAADAGLYRPSLRDGQPGGRVQRIARSFQVADPFEDGGGHAQPAAGLVESALAEVQEGELNLGQSLKGSRPMRPAAASASCLGCPGAQDVAAQLGQAAHGESRVADPPIDARGPARITFSVPSSSSSTSSCRPEPISTPARMISAMAASTSSPSSWKVDVARVTIGSAASRSPVCKRAVAAHSQRRAASEGLRVGADHCNRLVEPAAGLQQPPISLPVPRPQVPCQHRQRVHVAVIQRPTHGGPEVVRVGLDDRPVRVRIGMVQHVGRLGSAEEPAQVTVAERCRLAALLETFASVVAHDLQHLQPGLDRTASTTPDASRLFSSSDERPSSRSGPSSSLQTASIASTVASPANTLRRANKACSKGPNS